MAKVKDNVKNKVDWIIHAVIPEYDDSYILDAHTHGLGTHGHPELRTVLNLPPETLTSVINSVGLDIVDGERFDEERVYTNILANDMRVQIIRDNIGGDDCSVLIFPDANNRLPGEPFCQIPYKNQLKYLEEIRKTYDEPPEY